MSAAAWLLAAAVVTLLAVVVFAWHWIVLAAFGFVVIHELRRRRDRIETRGRP